MEVRVGVGQRVMEVVGLRRVGVELPCRCSTRASNARAMRREERLGGVGGRERGGVDGTVMRLRFRGVQLARRDSKTRGDSTRTDMGV
jgi:hypothetical protein